MGRVATWIIVAIVALTSAWGFSQRGVAQAKSFRIEVPTKYATQVKGDVIFLTHSERSNFARIEFSAQSGGQTSQDLLDKEWNRRLRGIPNSVTLNTTIKLGAYTFSQRTGSAKISNTDQFYGLWTIAGDKVGFLAELSASTVSHGETYLPDMVAMLKTLQFSGLPTTTESDTQANPPTKPSTPPTTKPDTNPTTKPPSTPDQPRPNDNPSTGQESQSGFYIDAGSSRLQEIAMLGRTNLTNRATLMEEAILLCGFDIVEQSDPKKIITSAVGTPRLGVGLTKREIETLAEGWASDIGIAEKSYFAMMQIAAKSAGSQQNVRAELQEWLSDGSISKYDTKRRLSVFLTSIGVAQDGASLLSEEIGDGMMSIPQVVILTKILSRDLFEAPPAVEPNQFLLAILSDNTGYAEQDARPWSPPPLERIVLPDLTKVDVPEKVQTAGKSVMHFLIEAVRLQVALKPQASLIGNPERMERTKTTVPDSKRTIQLKLDCSFPGMNDKINNSSGDSATVVADKISNAPVSNANINWQLDVIFPALVNSATGSSKGVTNTNGIYALDIVGAPQEVNLGADAFSEDYDLPTFGQWRVRYTDSPLAKARFRLEGGSPLAQSILREMLAELEWTGTFDYNIPFRDWHDNKFHGEIRLSSTKTEDTTAGEPSDPKPTFVLKRNTYVSAKFLNLVAKDVLFSASDAYPADVLRDMPAEVRARLEKEAKEMENQPLFLNAEKGSYESYLEGSGYQNLEEADCEVQNRTSKSLNEKGRLKLKVSLDGPAYASIELDRKKMVGLVRILVPVKAKSHYITRTGLVKTKVTKSSGVRDFEISNFGEPDAAEKRLGGDSNTLAFPLQFAEYPGVVAFSATITRKYGPEPKTKGVMVVTIKGKIHRPRAK